MTNDDNYGPWIEWAGGECPIPGDASFDVKFRDRTMLFKQANSSYLNWRDNQAYWDIIAYRVRLPADDLLRQAIEALRVVKTSVSPDTIIGIKIAAVLASAAERGL